MTLTPRIEKILSVIGLLIGVGLVALVKWWIG